MDVINALVVILGGILALSGLIIAKKPDAKATLDKLLPFQALIGIAMIALGLINFLRMLGVLTDMFKVNMIFAASVWAMLGVSIVLGLLLGMPQIAKWMGSGKAAGAEHKLEDLVKKIAPYQTLLGIVGIVASLVYLLYRFNIIHFN